MEVDFATDTSRINRVDAGSSPVSLKFLTSTAGNALDSKSMRTIRPELTGIASMTMLESAS